MVEFKTQYGVRWILPSLVSSVETDGNQTVVNVKPVPGNLAMTRYIVSDSYSEAMRKLGRNV